MTGTACDCTRSGQSSHLPSLLKVDQPTLEKKEMKVSMEQAEEYCFLPCLSLSCCHCIVSNPAEKKQPISLGQRWMGRVGYGMWCGTQDVQCGIQDVVWDTGHREGPAFLLSAQALGGRGGQGGGTNIQEILHGRVQHHQVREEGAKVGNSALHHALWGQKGQWGQQSWDQPRQLLGTGHRDSPARLTISRCCCCRF